MDRKINDENDDMQGLLIDNGPADKDSVVY